MTSTTPISTDLALNFIKLAVMFGADPNWQQEKVSRILEIERSRRVSIVEVDHEIEILRERHKAELVRVRMEEEQSTKDYSEFIESMGKLKTDLRKAYPKLPEAMLLLIYQHARRMLDSMWKQKDMQSEQMWRSRLLVFMQVVCEDTIEAANTPQVIPFKTLEAIRQV